MELSRPVWYRTHPSAALIAAVCLFAAVTALQAVADSSGEAVSVLYTLPIALLAVAFGRKGGLTGALLGFVASALFTVYHSTGDIDATGWVTRATAMFLLGGLLGHATDQSLASERRMLVEQRRRHELEAAERREREAMEVNDSIIQGMVAAKWMAELGRTDEAIEALATTIARGQSLVAALLPRAIGGRRASPDVSRP